MTMNIARASEMIKDLSEQQLAAAAQYQVADIPPYMALAEMQRRKKLMAEQQAGPMPTTTVMQDMLAAPGVPSGGITQLAGAMAPKTDMAKDTGATQMPQSTRRMAEGGYYDSSTKRYAGGRSVVIDGQRYDIDPATETLAERLGMTPEEYIRTLGPNAALNQRRVERNQMLELEPMGDGVAFPTQADLDVAARDEAVGIGTVPRGMAEPSLSAVPNMPGPSAGPVFDVRAPELVAATPDVVPQGPAGIAMPPNWFSPDGTPRRSTPLNEIIPDIPQAGPSAPVVPTPDANGMVYSGRGDAGGIQQLYAQLPERERTMMNESSAFEGINDYAPAPLFEGPYMTPGQAIDRYAAFEAGTPEDYTGPRPTYVGPGSDVVEGVPTGDLSQPRPQARDDAAVPPDMLQPAAPATPPGGGGSGSARGAGAASTSSTQTGPMDDMARQLTRDKWLALAEFGLGLMSSNAPTLGKAIGEAGLPAVQSMRAAQENYNKYKLADRELQQQMQIAQMRAASGGRGGGGLDVGDLLRYYGELTEQREALAMNPAQRGALERLDAQIAQVGSAINQVFGMGGTQGGGMPTYDTATEQESLSLRQKFGNWIAGS